MAWTAPPCVTFHLVVVSLRGPGQSPVLPFACCVELLLSVGTYWCSCWCWFRVCGTQWLVCWGCAGCGKMCRLRASGDPPPPTPAKKSITSTVFILESCDGGVTTQTVDLDHFQFSIDFSLGVAFSVHDKHCAHDDDVDGMGPCSCAKAACLCAAQWRMGPLR